MASNMPKLDIIIPGRNEAENLPELVGRIDSALAPHNIPYSIIFVDDHSIDNSKRIAIALADKYPLIYHSNQNQSGKAHAILAGVELSKAPYVAMLDADLEYSKRFVVVATPIDSSTSKL